MSVDLVASAEEAKDSIIKPDEDDGLGIKSENVIAPKSVAQVVNDLEDGEIDDDDDNDEPIVILDSKIIRVGHIADPIVVSKNKSVPQSLPIKNTRIMMDSSKHDSVKTIKSKSKHQAAEDDFAGSIESAIAAALKKDGIMPPMPKILEAREEAEKKEDKELSLSKSSRRRKRRKLRDDREKDKEKKKSRGSSPDTTKAAAMTAAVEEELEDDEMLCVRGGSPPPAGILPILPSIDPILSRKKESYDSDDSYTSYDSYDSAPNYKRYSSSRKKESNTGGSSSSRSKRKERSRRDEERRSEKRNRRNYDESGGEDRHPQQPRKLELCKFYLMECCAKKDKCSYMHSDFPCKYYYLGMECVYRASCKFSHGKPLSEQLRNVLLKHLETAPKEILGTFRRISRENALNLMIATHDKICQEHGVENTMSPQTMTTQSVVHTQTGMRNSDLAQQQPQSQQMQNQSEVIPSLLDMVIKGPSNPNDSSGTTSIAGIVVNSNKPEKQRKSRWCDSVANNPIATSSAALKQQTYLQPPSSNAPSYLDLKNLTGILSTDRIEKLSKFGIVNLEQINQLTLSQLNKIGLTINEITEIQLNARNMARLGVSGVGIHADVTNSTNISSTTNTLTAAGSIPSNQDVDMRFLPSCLPLTTPTITTSTVTSDKSLAEICLSTSDPSQSKCRVSTPPGSNIKDSHPVSSSNIGGIDYSQYLRDSNLGYDKNDLLDDEKDEEQQLIIDDQDLDLLDDSQTREPGIKNESDSNSRESFGYGGGDFRAHPSPHIQNCGKVENILNDSANLYTVDVSEFMKTKEGLCDKVKPDAIHTKTSPLHHDDDVFYGADMKPNKQHCREKVSRGKFRDPRHRETREEYRDPRHQPEPKDEYRDNRRICSRSNIEHKERSTISYKANTRSDDESDRDRSNSRSRSRSRSDSPTPSLSHIEHFQPLYERQTMYDWTPNCVQEDQEYSRRNTKADKDMRLVGFRDSSNSDIDLRLPFQPVKNIQIAKEIDGSMSTLMPIPYKILEVDVPSPKYSDLRQSFLLDDTADPRLRRIIGLPELSNSKALVALGRHTRATIASPSSVESSSSPTRTEKDRLSAAPVRGPRLDPRRASVTTLAATSSSSSTQAQVPPLPTGNPQQNVEIRLLLQKSDWYKNLNSKAKIMVNQQLALVSTELKRYHQDPSPNKVFDIQFIVSNQSLQEILTCLGIYIDDNGQVAHVENDNDHIMMGVGMGIGRGIDYVGVGNPIMMMNDPSMNMQQRMAIQNQIEFLHRPPPNMNMMRPMGPGGGPGGQGIYSGPCRMMPTYGRNQRMGLLGMGPVNSTGSGGGFNPFAGNPGDNSGGRTMDPNYCSPTNPFSNNFRPNGGNFGGQQLNRCHRNQGRQGGGGALMNNGGIRNSNRRPFKQNRRGGGGGGCGGGSVGGSRGGDEGGGAGSVANVTSGIRNASAGGISSGSTTDSHASAPEVGEHTTGSNQNTNGGDDDEEESWDD